MWLTLHNVMGTQQIMAHMKRLGEPQEDATELLHLAFMSVDNKMSQFEYEGCTATVVLVWRYGSDRYVQAANAGDSSAFMKCVPLAPTLMMTRPPPTQTNA
jgi:hypothetical protein